MTTLKNQNVLPVKEVSISMNLHLHVNPVILSMKDVLNVPRTIASNANLDTILLEVNV